MSESSMVLGDEKVDMLRKKKKKESKKNKGNIDTIGGTTTDGNAMESDVSVEEEKLSDVETSKKGDGAKKQAKRAGGDDCDVKRKKKRDGDTHPGKADKDDDDDTAKSVEKKKHSKLKRSHHDKRQKMDDASLDNNTIAHASTSETWDDKMETEAAGGDACDVKRKKKKKKEAVTHPGKSNEDRDEDVVESVEKKKHKKSKRSDQDEQQTMDDTSLNNKTIPHANTNETRGDKMESIAAGDGDCDAKGKKRTEATHPGKSNKDRDEDTVESVEKKKHKKLKRSHQDEQQIAPLDDETIANASTNETPDTGKAVEAFNNGSGENSVDEIRRKKKKSKKSNNNAATNSVELTNTDVIEDEGRTGHSNIKKRKKVKLRHDSENSTHEKSKKRVRFSGDVQIFPLSSNPSDENHEMGEENLVRGRRFSKLEDETVKEAVHKYIEIHNLGEEGLEKILNSRSHPEVKGCWKEIGSAIPYRPYSAVYYRAQILFRRSESRKWTKEEYEMVLEFQKQHGNNWKDLAEELGKHRFHVKDTWRRLKLPNQNKGQWTQEEYQNLFDLVNTDLRLKLSEEKKSKHGMLRDNIPWTAISDSLSTRTAPNCCLKWYDQLTSPMVAKGEWDDADDYRLVDSLFELDASCIEDVDWDNLLDHRPGEICRKRWNQMVHHIGQTVGKSFAEQVEVLAKRYRPDLAEVREAWDSKPVVE